MSKRLHTYPKWYKTLFPEQLSFTVQEACWVKTVWIVPHSGISMDRPQVGQNNSSFGNSVASEL